MAWFLFALALCLLLGLNWPHFHPQTTAQALAGPDAPRIWLGYTKTPNLLVDGLKWWYGSWIYANNGSFRPLTSYVHWLQVDIGLKYSFGLLSLFTVSLFALCCALCGLLTYRFTKSLAAAILAVAVLSLFRYHDDPEWVMWWPIVDNFLSLGFLLAGIIAFDLWNEEGKACQLRASWVLFIASVFSKEYGFVFPLMAYLILIGRSTLPEIKEKTPVIRQMWVVAIALFLYRRMVLPVPYRAAGLQFDELLLLKWGPHTTCLSHPWTYGLLGLTIVFSYSLYAYRNHHNGLAIRLALILAYFASMAGYVMVASPRNGMAPGEVGLVILADNGLELIKGWVQLTCAVALAYFIIRSRPWQYYRAFAVPLPIACLLLVAASFVPTLEFPVWGGHRMVYSWAFGSILLAVVFSMASRAYQISRGHTSPEAGRTVA